MNLRLVADNRVSGLGDEQLQLLDLKTLDHEHQKRLLLRLQAERSLVFVVPEQRS
jgi:hypothetical protein